MFILNKEEVEFGAFPNGETYLEMEPLRTRAMNDLEWTYEGDADIFKLKLLKVYLDSTSSKTRLKINYMPHSRMDRNNTTYVMSLTVVADMINDMKFQSVMVVEPHSDVTPAVLHNCWSSDWCLATIDKVITLCEARTLFFPDAGAAKRYTYPMPYAVGMKRRDFASGAITDFSLMGDVGESVLIVDDLCSRGGTFVHSAKLLKEHGAKNVYLLVANCEKTVLSGELFDHIDHLYVAKHNYINLPAVPADEVTFL